MRDEFKRTANEGPGRPLTHRVVLTKPDHKKLKQIIKEPKNALQLRRAKVLLALDEGELAKHRRKTYTQIAMDCGVATSTVCRIAKRFVSDSVEAIVDAHATGPRITAAEEKKLIELVNTYNLESIAWSLRSLARELGRSRMAVSQAIERLNERGEIDLTRDP